MNKSGFRLFTLMGFTVSADWSWLLIAILLSWSLATSYFPPVLNSDTVYWGAGIVSSLLLFFSVVLHEIGHSYVARRSGIRILGIRLFIFGGVAQMDREPPSPEIELKVALAGPAVSAALALLFTLFADIAAAGGLQPVSAVMAFLSRANTAMVVFNLIPGFPMDGGRVLRALVWNAKRDYYTATILAGNVGRYVAFTFMGLGVLMAFTGGFTSGLWLLLIGMFLHQAAKSSLLYAGYARRRLPLEDWNVSLQDFVHAEISVQRFIKNYLRFDPTAQYPVVLGNRIIGIVDAEAVRRVPPVLRRMVSVGEVAKPLHYARHDPHSNWISRLLEYDDRFTVLEEELFDPWRPWNGRYVLDRWN